MSKFGKNSFQTLRIIGTRVSYPYFHTSRSILPNLTQGENQSQTDYLQCLRPATMALSDAPTLAGDPKALRPEYQGIESEVYKKWSSKPEMPHKDWSTYTWWGRNFF